jgi:hypothetical protein
MDPKHQNAQAVENSTTVPSLREAIAETERQWNGDLSPLRRALRTHFELYNLTAPRKGLQRNDL